MLYIFVFFKLYFFGEHQFDVILKLYLSKIIKNDLAPLITRREGNIEYKKRVLFSLNLSPTPTTK